MTSDTINIQASYNEKDIENWLYAHPQYIGSELRPYLAVSEWVHKQYTLPSGIADLIGMCIDGRLIVVEVKNVPLNKAALTQVSRYRYDLQRIAERFVDYPRLKDGTPHVYAMIIGPSIDPQTHIEAHALDVAVMCFQVQFWVHCYSQDYRMIDESEKINLQLEILASRREWDVLGKRLADVEPDELDQEIEEIADNDRNGIPEWYGDQRMVDVLAAECPYPSEPVGLEWVVNDAVEEE